MQEAHFLLVVLAILGQMPPPLVGHSHWWTDDKSFPQQGDHNKAKVLGIRAEELLHAVLWREGPRLGLGQRWLQGKSNPQRQRLDHT